MQYKEVSHLTKIAAHLKASLNLSYLSKSNRHVFNIGIVR